MDTYKTRTNAIRLALAAAAVAVLAACGTVPGLADAGAYKTGTQVSEDQLSKIVENKSTQADVVALLGQPTRKAQVAGKETWYYDFQQIGQALIGRNINESTVVEFNSKGVVTSRTKTAGPVSNPLLKSPQ